MSVERQVEQKLEQRAKEELTEIDAERAYDDMLDERYSFDSVGGPFSGMSPSRVLQEVDPTAYRCGFSDWTDGMSDQWEEVGASYYDKSEVDDLRDTIREEIEAELEDEEYEEENG